MGLSKNGGVRVEIREISDADDPPKACPHCGSPKYTRSTYNFRDIQDLGEPGVKRIVRYEKVVWICKKCNTYFTIKNSEIFERHPFMPGVIKYATYRVLEKGDSARRVLSDLHELHNVDVKISAINNWVNEEAQTNTLPTDFSHVEPLTDFSGGMSLDGTFRSVKEKKSAMPEGEKGQLWLRLTHLEDGRLLAYWRQEKMKPKYGTSFKS